MRGDINRRIWSLSKLDSRQRVASTGHCSKENCSKKIKETMRKVVAMPTRTEERNLLTCAANP